MKKFRKGLSGLLAFVMALSAMVCNMAVTASAAEHTVWIVGDSTSCDYKETDDATYFYKRVGFGTKLIDYVQEGKATVENLALSGRSSKSFLSEKNYKKLMGTDGTDGMQSGDYLIIAFGHNDEKIEEAALYTSPGGTKETEGSFKNSLYKNYIEPAQNKGVTPVLCTPIVRHPSGSVWTDKDEHKDNGGDYAQDIRDLASECNIDCIDLTTLTKEKYTDLEAAKKYHAWINEKTVDNTHLNNYGAKMVACLIAKNAKNGLKSLFVADPQEPTEADDLKQNLGYQAPKEGDYSLEELGTHKSKVWNTTKENWYGSVFGSGVGNITDNTNFDIIETSAENKVQIKAGITGDKGKVSKSDNGIAMYFTCIPANTNIYQISANVTINNIDSADNQVAFGAIISDEISIDNAADSPQITNFNYVAAGPVNIGSGMPNSSFSVDKTTSTMTTGDVLPAIPAAGDEVTVKIVKYGNRYATSYKTPYGNFIKEYTLSDEQMSGYIYPGFFAARNADITFTDIVANGEATEPGDGALITRLSGKVTYTESPENGSVTLVKTADNGSVSSGTQVDGETELKLTATPSSAAYYPVIKVGEKELIPTNNSYTWKVDGDVNFDISFADAQTRSPITGALEWKMDGTHNEYVQEYNKHNTAPFYFELTSNTTFDTANNRISLGGGNATNASILFNTGDLSSGETSISVEFMTGNSAASRSVVLGCVEDNTTVTLGTSGSTEHVKTEPHKLDSNKNYYITSAGSTIYIYGITFTSEAYVNVTPSFKCDGEDVTGTYTIEGVDGTHNTGGPVSLKEGSYNIVLTDSEGTEYKGTLEVTSENQSPEVTLIKVTEIEITGTVTIQGKDKVEGVTLKYIDSDKGEHAVTNIAENGKYSINLAPGTYTVEISELEGYEISSLSKKEIKFSSTTPSENFKNILYKKNAVAATAFDVYVNAKGDESKQNVYPTLAEALAGIRAAEKGGKKATAEQKWVIHFAPGTYREQNVVDINNVTFTSNYDGTRTVENDGKVTLTWYYGVGYKYYSIEPKTTSNSNYPGQSYYRGLYNIEYAYDKHNLTATADRWGTTVRVEGDNFYAEGITFENSFNRYMTDEEIADGVTLAEPQEFDANKRNTEVVRTKETDVRTKAATERAAVLDLNNNQAEFYKCSLKSSQDTLYMQAGKNYFKECTIMGETDYIFGAEQSIGIFDKCNLVWAGYVNPGNNGAGYVTATRGRLIFRDCPITAETDLNSIQVTHSDGNAVVTPGYYGRPWGDTANVTFIRSETNGQIVKAGWNDMSTELLAKNATFKEYGNTSDSTEFKSELAGAQLTEAEAQALAAENDYNFFGSWLPKNHDPYSTSAPKVYDFDLSQGIALSAGSTQDITSENEDASITLIGETRKHAKAGTQIMAGSSIKFTAGGEGESIPVKIDFNINANAINVKVNEIDGNEVSSPKDVKSGDSIIEFNAVPGKSYEIVFSNTTTEMSGGVPYSSGYSKTISITTKGTISAYVSKEKAYTFDFTKADSINLSNTTSDFNSTNSDASITLDATGGAIKFWDQTNGFNFKTASSIKFTVGGDKTPVKVTAIFNVKNNNTNAALYNINDLNNPVAEAIALKNGNPNTITFEATSGETYAIVIGTAKDMEVGTGDVFCPSLTITTEGTISAYVPPKTTVATWNFNPNENTELSGLNISGYKLGFTANNASITLYVDASASDAKFKDNSGGYIQISHSTIKIPVYAVGDTVKFDVYNTTKYTINGEAVNNNIYTVKDTDVDKGYIEAVVPVDGGSYIKSITLTTTGEVPEPAFVFSKYAKAAGDSNTTYVIGKIEDSLKGNVTNVGINAATSKAGVLAEDASVLKSDTVYSEVVDESKIDEKAGAGEHIAAIKVEEVTGKFYVAAYSEIDGHKVYDSIQEVNVQ